MKAVVFDQFGEPRDVLTVRDVPVPEVGPGQARVRMIASPLNPSDLLVVRGKYGRLPRMPATPGFEGVGVIDAVGPGLLAKVRGLRPGKRVAVLNPHGGNWAEFVILPARNLVPVPDDLPDEQVAMFFVNPATVVVMVRHVLKVSAGSWLLQTAAGSALGRMIIRLGKHQGFRTLNVVRRREQVAELKQLGADAVVCTTDESLPDQVRELTNGSGVPYAVDAVGGLTGLAAVQCLGRNGRILLYGTLSGEPIPLDLRTVLVGQKKLEGFWLSEWVQDHRIFTMLGLFRQVFKLLRAGVLTSEIGALYSLDQIREAVIQADTAGRQGKVLLRMTTA